MGWVREAFRVPVATGWVHATVEALRAMSGGQALWVVLGLLGLCGLGLPMPEDIILISAGYLVSLGKFSMSTAIAAGTDYRANVTGLLRDRNLLVLVPRQAVEVPASPPARGPLPAALGDVRLEIVVGAAAGGEPTA